MFLFLIGVRGGAAFQQGVAMGCTRVKVGVGPGKGRGRGGGGGVKGLVCDLGHDIPGAHARGG